MIILMTIATKAAAIKFIATLVFEQNEGKNVEKFKIHLERDQQYQQLEINSKREKALES